MQRWHAFQSTHTFNIEEDARNIVDKAHICTQSALNDMEDGGGLREEELQYLTELDDPYLPVKLSSGPSISNKRTRNRTIN